MKTSKRLPQYLYITDFQKSSDVGTSKLLHMSYLSYMTNHYQHAINDQANATKATKYIQHYGYKKPFLKSENTENER